MDWVGVEPTTLARDSRMIFVTIKEAAMERQQQLSNPTRSTLLYVVLCLINTIVYPCLKLELLTLVGAGYTSTLLY
jgi:hypothetical protein